ncbi:hypothetical protein EV421DRAFT_974277 [Armillaria borealis]|uniref:Uncharacterized protein n=1 Tax=Armillaria borealis TaxID=47425 RepID=A0AA39JCR9_9AGAR|nr:hypothetical protein EV421DRAFT_974277 [Armillaria borealis]
MMGSIVWARGVGGSYWRRAVLSMKTAHRREVGCAANARSYPHDSILRVNYKSWPPIARRGRSYWRFARGYPYTQRIYQALLNTNTGTPREGWCSLQNSVHVIGNQRHTRAEPWPREQDDACCCPPSPHPKRGFPVTLIPLTRLPLCAYSLYRCLLIGFLPNISLMQFSLWGSILVNDSQLWT